jgi:hypothetical protein
LAGQPKTHTKGTDAQARSGKTAGRISKRARHPQSGEKQNEKGDNPYGIAKNGSARAVQDFGNLGEHCDLRCCVAILFSSL